MTAPFALGFDFDHTLGFDHGLERRAFYALADEVGAPIDPHDGVWPERLEALLDAFRQDRLSRDAMVARFGEWLGVPDLSPQRWESQCYALVDALVEPVDGARELLALLRERGVPRAILTNGWTPLQQKKVARALGDEARHLRVLVSDAIGAVKPERAAFEALVAALATPRECCWYVGDNVRGDVGGALGAGLRAVWFDADGASYPQDVPRPTLHIRALRELETLIENTSVP
ncbi:MAG: HAD family hydrolase [Vulcanimicrobiaceae bacterium]